MGKGSQVEGVTRGLIYVPQMKGVTSQVSPEVRDKERGGRS
jgi:hypothetical protein